MKPVFFEDSSALRAWLEASLDREDELWVGFWKKGTGRPSIDWPQLVDVLLCYGWIDGLRKSIDSESYMIRITPRRPRSNWSDVNIRRIGELIELGVVKPAGLAVFRRWDESAAGRAAADDSERGEARPQVLSAEFERRFRANLEGWEFFEEQPPGYRRTATEWVMSAKREDTRLRRLETLIADSAAGLRIKEMRR
jgi:uncharacterized protein YdeI (YjbR/CyaY-like superfamily)